jgi:hypothetical protein
MEPLEQRRFLSATVILDINGTDSADDDFWEDDVFGGSGDDRADIDDDLDINDDVEDVEDVND